MFLLINLSVALKSGSGGRSRAIFDAFSGMEKRMEESPRPILEQVTDVWLSKVFPKHFARQGGESPWAPLAPSTVKERGSSRPILIRTGSYRRSIRRLKATKQKVVVGTDDIRANALQYGRKKFTDLKDQTRARARGRSSFTTESGMPARLHVILHEDEVDESYTTIMDWLMEPWEK